MQIFSPFYPYLSSDGNLNKFAYRWLTDLYSYLFFGSSPLVGMRAPEGARLCYTISLIPVPIRRSPPVGLGATACGRGVLCYSYAARLGQRQRPVAPAF